MEKLVLGSEEAKTIPEKIGWGWGCFQVMWLPAFIVVCIISWATGWIP